MRINAKGQVTIPAAIRREAGLLPYMDVDFEFDGIGVRIVHSASPRKGNRGERLIAALCSAGQGAMTTDEIMALTRGE